MDFASRIQELRKKAGLSQEALAEQLGISRQALGKWETGASLPTLDNLAQLAKIFNVSIDELITGIAPESEIIETAPLTEDTAHTLIRKLDEQAPRRTSKGLIAVLAGIMAALVILSIVLGVGLYQQGSRISMLEARIGILESRSVPDASLIYQQVLAQLTAEYELPEESNFYFEYEVTGCDLGMNGKGEQTMTLDVWVTPRQYREGDRMQFLFSPMPDSDDTLADTFPIEAILSDGQYRMTVTLPLVSDLVVYVQFTDADGVTQQQLGAKLYDLSRQFIPGFSIDGGDFSFHMFNYATLTVTGEPEAYITPPTSAAAPMPETLKATLYYNDVAILIRKYDLTEHFDKTIDNGFADVEEVIPGGITYFIDTHTIEEKRFDYIEDAVLRWEFVLTDTYNNSYTRTLTYKP